MADGELEIGRARCGMPSLTRSAKSATI